MREDGHSNTLSRAASIPAWNAAPIPPLTHLTPDACHLQRLLRQKVPVSVTPTTKLQLPYFAGRCVSKEPPQSPMADSQREGHTTNMAVATGQPQEKQRLWCLLIWWPSQITDQSTII